MLLILGIHVTVPNKCVIESFIDQICECDYESSNCQGIYIIKQYYNTNIGIGVLIKENLHNCDVNVYTNGTQLYCPKGDYSIRPLYDEINGITYVLIVALSVTTSILIMSGMIRIIIHMFNMIDL